MATIKVNAATRTLALADVAPAAFALASARGAAVAAVRAALAVKVKQDDIRARFIVGYVARLLAPADAVISSVLLDDAAKVLKLKGYVAPAKVQAASKTKPGKGAAQGTTAHKAESRRSEAQERAYTAARTQWSRVLADAGLTAMDKRGGARANAGRKGTKVGSPSKMVAPAPAPVPTAPSGTITPLGKVTPRGTIAPPKLAKGDIPSFAAQLAALIRTTLQVNADMAPQWSSAFDDARKALERVKA